MRCQINHQQSGYNCDKEATHLVEMIPTMPDQRHSFVQVCEGHTHVFEGRTSGPYLGHWEFRITPLQSMPAVADVYGLMHRAGIDQPTAVQALGGTP
jgi:hypothetical protein